MKAELVFYNGATLLEGPVWDEKKQILYFVSIRQNTVHAYHPKDRSCRSYDVGCAVGCCDLLPDGNLIIAKKDGVYQLNTETGALTFVVNPIDNDLLRFNDGKLDPRGRFLAGTMGDLETIENGGCLYSIEGKRYRVLIPNVTISNGLGFSPDQKTFYFIDTPTRKVMAYEYDLETGNIAYPRVVVKFVGKGVPDGMCVDREGMLWVAEWGGSRVSGWNPYTGTQIGIIELPCKNVSSCCLGGKNKNELYITTAKDKNTIRGEIAAGGLFRMVL